MRLVKATFLHPNYTWNDKEFDIGLVKLLTPFRLTDYIQVLWRKQSFMNTF